MIKSEKNSAKKQIKKGERPARRRFPLPEMLQHFGLPLPLQRFLLLVLLAGLLAFVIVPKGLLIRTDYRPGDIARSDIKATRDMLFPDQGLTAGKIAEAEKSVPVLYDFDASAGLTIADHLIGTIIRAGEELRRSGNLEQVRGRYEAALGIQVGEKNLKALLSLAGDPESLEELRETFIHAYREKVSASMRLFAADRSQGVVFRNLATREESRDQGAESVIDLDDLQKKIVDGVQKAGLESAQKEAVISLLPHLLRPSISLNQNEYEHRKQLARESVQPVLFQVKKGEMLVREGDRIAADQLVKISAMEESPGTWAFWRHAGGLLLTCFLLLYIGHRFAWRNIRKYRAEYRDLVFMLTTLLGAALLFKVGIVVASALGSAFPSVEPTAYYYLLPFAVGTMLVRIVLNSEVALVFASVASIFAGMLFGNSFVIFVFAFLSSLAAAHWVRQVTERSSLFKAGMRLSLFNALIIFGLHLLTAKPLDLQLLFKLGFGITGGLAVAVIVTGLVPLVEAVFCYTTNVKLLELANMNNRFLRDLVIRAPGTYHHSIVVGNLAETAAETIGANPLLARVAAYYHDIGKVRKPLYFAENIYAQENRHSKLAPSMSALILQAHVKDGVDMAREARLGQDLIDIIQQHHGTSMMKYFFEKAKNSEDPGVQQANESDYRYPGPKPQTREAALIMLADAVEAAGRTLVDPTPARIQGMVQKIVNNIFIDGQLDECELTLKDLHKIAKSFNLVLSGTFHHRIDYPEPVWKERSLEKILGQYDKNSDRKSTKENQGQKGTIKKGGTEDLKRLGMS